MNLKTEIKRIGAIRIGKMKISLAVPRTTRIKKIIVNLFPCCEYSGRLFINFKQYNAANMMTNNPTWPRKVCIKYGLGKPAIAINIKWNRLKG